MPSSPPRISTASCSGRATLYPYGLKQTSWRDGKGDVVADFVASCRKAGIKPGIYFSVHRNVYQQVWGHYADWGKGRGTPAQEKFNRIAEKQMEELCSRYGPLIQIWFDAGTKTPAEGGPDLLPIFEKHQPDSVFYSSTQRSDHRWIGNEAGFAGYPCWATMPGDKARSRTTRPAGKSFSAAAIPTAQSGHPAWWMCHCVARTRFTTGSGRRTRSTRSSRPKSWCRCITSRSAGTATSSSAKSSSLTGCVPEADTKRLAEFGAEIKRRYGKPVAETPGTGARVELKLPAPARIDSLVIMEDIAHGERIQNYTLAGKLPGGEWRELAHGQSVGHKRIEQVPPTEVTAVRLLVDKSKSEPRIRKLAAYGSARTGS